MMESGKKAQVSYTMTWAIAFLIIFFVMILFISATMVASSKKQVTSGRDEISLNEYLSKDKLRAQRIYYSFLDSKILYEGEKKEIRDLLVEWEDSSDKENIRKIIWERFDKLFKNIKEEQECYIMDLTYKDGNDLRFNSLYEENEAIRTVIENNLLDKGIDTVVFGNEEIKFRFFLGRCQIW